MMSSEVLGLSLLNFLRTASYEVVLVAPFIKVGILEKLLSEIAIDVSVTCITRWRLAEIASGVSDPGVWELVDHRANSRLFLNNNLHAKYYRADTRCLIGSANLTATALGWAQNPNIEILLPPADECSWQMSFEASLLASSVEVDDALYRSVTEAVDAMPCQLSLETAAWGLSGEEAASFVDKPIQRESWLPNLRHPENLYIAYCDDLEQLTTLSRSLALKELTNFNVLPGLSKKVFEAEIGIQMLAQPIIHEVDSFLRKPRRFGEVRDYIKGFRNEVDDDFDASAAWQTLMRWLLHFLPDRYATATPSHSEIMFRRY